ncbi:LysR family substrate-binding domain-containing protein [Scytonema sp. UIC 10036]|uniref:LysR family substrate-binding domain-containing protein n=1 Tax=Scytonema sp. UIC 10036 TaxID=2304196 RepID=UPI001FA9A7C4|nr:LysR family substrate-binding domain-containing protein [Scytonema sp. UIC 10036]
MNKAFIRSNQGAIGQLVVAFEGSSAYDIIPMSLKAYRERFPDVELVVLGMTTNEQIEALREGQIHAGFMVPPLQGQVEDLGLETVIQAPLVLALPEAHPLAAKAKVKVRSLANEAFIIGQRHSGCGLFDQVIAVCRSAGFSPVIKQEVNEMQVLLGLVAAGFGIAILPESAKQFQRLGVIYRELQPTSPQVALAIAWRKSNSSPLVQAFLQIVRENSAYIHE